MTRAAQIIWERLGDDAMSVAQAEAVAAEVEEALRGKIEQRLQNDDVRRGADQGFCPTCGAEWHD